LLALPLAEIQLRGCGNRHLDHPVGQLPGRHLVEPDAMQARMIGPDGLEDLLPDHRVQQRFQSATDRQA